MVSLYPLSIFVSLFSIYVVGGVQVPERPNGVSHPGDTTIALVRWTFTIFQFAPLFLVVIGAVMSITNPDQLKDLINLAYSMLGYFGH